jgi:uncharacterized MAPEG superfamily protein
MDGLGWKKSSIIISVMTHLTIAYWCVLVAIILPIIWIGFAKAGTRNYIHEHNSAPRELLNTLTGFRKRAVWAQQNAFEALPGFIAGSIIAHLMEASQFELDITALIFIIARLAHGIFYLIDWAFCRSVVWVIGFGATINMFLISI